MRTVYAAALCEDPAATGDELREAVTTFEDTERIARRVLGGAHPVTVDIERALRVSQAKLDAREAEVFERLTALEADEEDAWAADLEEELFS